MPKIKDGAMVIRTVSHVTTKFFESKASANRFSTVWGSPHVPLAFRSYITQSTHQIKMLSSDPAAS